MSWYTQEDFWLLFYDWMFPEASFKEAAEQADALTKLSGFETGEVLDLCCGPGRHSVPLAKCG